MVIVELKFSDRGSLKLLVESLDEAKRLREIERKIDDLFTRGHPKRKRIVSVFADSRRSEAAAIAALISRGIPVIAEPSSFASAPADQLIIRGADIVFLANSNDVSSLTFDGAYDVITPSSGSLGRRRLYGYRTTDMLELGNVYRGLYGAHLGTLIVTSLPPWYNFALVAGLFTTIASSSVLYLCDELSDVNWMLLDDFSNIVILGNPITLLSDQLNVRQLRRSMLVDSGGAPLPTPHIVRLRGIGLDVREGYGLTENLSLTHFDTEGDLSALGTVGRCLPFAAHRLHSIDGKPRLFVRSMFKAAPVRVDAMLQVEEETDGWIDTRDLAGVDRCGRLRILGRIDDEEINGLWPRDTLDIVGSLLSEGAALVQHQGGRALLRITKTREVIDEKGIVTAVSDFLKIAADRVILENSGGLLESIKIPRRREVSLSDIASRDYGP